MIALEFLNRPNKYTPNPIVTISITPPGIPIQDSLDSLDSNESLLLKVCELT